MCPRCSAEDVFRGKDFAQADWLQRAWGGLVDCFDRPRVDCAVDFSPGEVRIGYIRPGLLTESFIDAAPVNGSLLDSTLSDCLIELCTTGFSSTWTFCSTDSVLLAGFVLSVRRVNDVVNMAADGVALVEGEGWRYVWC